MRTSLFALFAAVGFALTAPINQAQASSCDWGLLRSYGRTWALAQFNPGLSCSDHAPGAIGTNCPSPIQNINVDWCTQQGANGTWEFIDNYNCQFSPSRVEGRIKWLPNTLYTYNYRCTCSEGNYSCAWF